MAATRGFAPLTRGVGKLLKSRNLGMAPSPETACGAAMATGLTGPTIAPTPDRSPSCAWVRQGASSGFFVGGTMTTSFERFDSNTVTIAFEADWDIGDDGQTWSRAEGSTCTINAKLREDGTQAQPNIKCRFRLLVKCSENTQTSNLVVAINGLADQDQTLFPGVEHEVVITLSFGIERSYQVVFRAYYTNQPPSPHGPVSERNSSDTRTALGVSIIGFCAERVSSPIRYKEALIAAGRACSISLFPPEAKLDGWWKCTKACRLSL